MLGKETGELSHYCDLVKASRSRNGDSITEKYTSFFHSVLNGPGTHQPYYPETIGDSYPDY